MKTRNQKPFPNDFTSFRLTQFMNSGSTLNSEKRFPCTDQRPCKRMSCIPCYQRRKAVFAFEGAAFAKAHGLDRHVVVTWLKKSQDELWPTLCTHPPLLMKALPSRKIEKYIRVFGIGETQATPHVHFLCSQGKAIDISKTTYRLWRGNVNIKIDPAPTPYGLLGYFFDQNFICSYLHPERPRRIRLLSASRGLRCGFPSWVPRQRRN